MSECLFPSKISCYKNSKLKVKKYPRICAMNHAQQNRLEMGSCSRRIYLSGGVRGSRALTQWLGGDKRLRLGLPPLPTDIIAIKKTVMANKMCH